jgi:hypothetical protein
MGKSGCAGLPGSPKGGDLVAPLPLSPPRATNASRRRREYLTPDEIAKIL